MELVSNDGVADITDIDDDNDGIPDAVEQYCANPTLANSISGTGAYQDNIYWFNWTDADFSDATFDITGAFAGAGYDEVGGLVSIEGSQGAIDAAFGAASN